MSKWKSTVAAGALLSSFALQSAWAAPVLRSHSVFAPTATSKILAVASTDSKPGITVPPPSEAAGNSPMASPPAPSVANHPAPAGANSGISEAMPAGSAPMASPAAPSPDDHASATESEVMDTPLSKSDRRFVSMATKGGLAEIAAAHVALEKSGSPDIKSFAQMMIDDHGTADEKLNTIAASDTPSTHPTAADRKMISKLTELSGAPFDHAYVKGQCRVHTQAIALFTHEAKFGHAGQLRMFAQNMLPTLKKHLAVAEQLAKDANAPS